MLLGKQKNENREKKKGVKVRGNHVKKNID